MLPDHASVAMLHQCTGNQFKILFALKLLGLDAPITQIAATANVNRDTASAALNALAVLGYTESRDRYHWRLTTACMQLPLWTPSELSTTPVDNSVNNLPPDAEIFRIRHSSSSSERVDLEKRTTTTPPPRDAENLRIPPTPTIAALMSAGATRAQAENAIARALDAGLTVTRDHVIAWQHYARDRPSINNPGAFICARLGAGQIAPPETRTCKSVAFMTPEERHTYYVPTGYEDIVQH
jgi:hypothetical protein